MAENPLLPNRRLKEMLELMRRCRALDRHAQTARTALKRVPREAALAATTIQLETGDILLSSPSDTTAATLAPAQNKNPRVTWKAVIGPEENITLPRAPRLALAAAMAHGLRASGTGGLVLALTDAKTPEPSLARTLAYAQHARVPLLLTVIDATNGRGPANTISLSHLEPIARKLQLPLFPVDGEDAVAVYRVMQECSLRARNGEGPALIWCMMLAAASGKLTLADQPIARMEKYLAVRGLLPKKKPR